MLPMTRLSFAKEASLVLLFQLHPGGANILDPRFGFRQRLSEVVNDFLRHRLPDGDKRRSNALAGQAVRKFSG